MPPKRRSAAKKKAPPHPPPVPAPPMSHLPAATNGTGYGGDQHHDQRQRAQARAHAQKKETKEWQAWQSALQAFWLTSSGQKQPAAAAAGLTSRLTGALVGAASSVFGLSPTRKAAAAKKKDEKPAAEDDNPNKPSDSLLDTLKQVLRCQAPDWWWKQPQQNLYATALSCCDVIVERHPKSLGNPDDQESLVGALDELAQSAALLVQQRQSAARQQQTGASAAAKGEEEDVSLAVRVVALHQRAVTIARTVYVLPDLSFVEPQEYYRQALRPLAFDVVESFDEPKHYYDGSAGRYQVQLYATGAGAAKKADTSTPTTTTTSTVLWKELSTFRTSLPIEYGSSIFVRAVEGNMAKLRVLIIGPDDTPYANGCFLFDVSLGDDYPQKAPRVQFLTTCDFASTGQRMVRFNPNLYEDGKVCLSLLGTWAGPGWQPGESTLLQVLVSLQSLILGTSDPYFNEPGYQSSEGTPQGDAASKAYNASIRRYTLQVALLPFLKQQVEKKKAASSGEAASPTYKKKKKKGTKTMGGSGNYASYFPEFHDVVERHFKHKHRVITKQLFQWSQEDQSLGALVVEFGDLLEELHGATGRKRKRATASTGKTMGGPGEVLVLDDDDDDEMVALAVQESLEMSGKSGAKVNADGVIEIDVSSDEEDGNGIGERKSRRNNNKKPAASRAAPDRTTPETAAESVDAVVDLT